MDCRTTLRQLRKVKTLYSGEEVGVVVGDKVGDGVGIAVGKLLVGPVVGAEVGHTMVSLTLVQPDTPVHSPLARLPVAMSIHCDAKYGHTALSLLLLLVAKPYVKSKSVSMTQSRRLRA